nr:MAG TPA: hypothetical protein [Caudoviricetes sp.]
MISNITLGKSGLPEYLVSGRKVGSQYTRDEKDDRLFIDGSEEALKDSIDWVLKNKNWKNSYYHCTLAFTHEEWEQLSKEEGKLQEIVQEYLRLNFPNHQLNEIIYHAEAHVPKILYEPAEKRGGRYAEGELIERHPHIHIGISQQNALYSGQVSVGGIKGIASRAKSIEFKQCCDEILCSKFGLVPAVAGEGKEPVKRKSFEENLKIWAKYERAAQGRSKGKELKSTLDTNIDVVDVVYGDLSKTNPPKPIKINDDEIALKEIAKSRLKNLKKIYNPSEIEKQIDGAVMARLRDQDSGKLIPFIAEYFGIPKDKIRKSEGANKIEILQDGKWKTNSNTDFCKKILGLDREETVKLVTVFSALDAAGVGAEKLRTTIRGKELVKNIANIALDELGYKFQNIPSVKLSVSRNLERLLPEERIAEIRAKNPTKPVYVADKGFKTEHFSSLVELAKALDYTKIAGYSVANFRDGKRSNENIESMNPVIILDADNQPEIGNLIPQKDMEKKLEAKGISALLLPSASNSEEYNRYRVIVPTIKEFSLKGMYENWKEDYRAYIENFVDFLGIEEDNKKALDAAMFRPAQFYYGSAPTAEATLTNGKVFDNFDMLEKIYQEREKINANMQLKLKEKQYALAQKNIEKEVDIVFQNLKENEDKLGVGQDNDVALTRTVLSNINRVINVVDAARLRYPKAHIKVEGRHKILYTADQEQEGNRNLLGEFGAYNFSREKTRTSYDFMREYLELLNLRIAKFNNDNTLTMDEKEKLKNFLVNSPLISKLNEQPLEFKRINVYNGNNYAILVKHFFPNQYDKVCLINYRGIAQNLARYMKNIEDQEGLEQFKQHYRIKSVNLHNGKIGYLNAVSLKELRDIGGLSEEWINPKKPEK